MRAFLWILGIFCLAETVTIVRGLTNQEFTDLLSPYASGISEVNDDNDSGEESADVLTLPGNLEDEVDWEYLLEKLGEDLENIAKDGASDLRWPHKNKKYLRSSSCSCRRYSCKCCVSHTFKSKWKKFHLHACLTLAYLRNNYGFMLTFTLNDHRLYHKEISLKHPPGLCYGVPGLKGLARVCLELYNINLQTKYACARLTGVINLKIKKFRVHLKLGCFTVPILDKDAFLMLVNDPDFLQIKRLGDEPSRDLTDPYLELQRELESQSADADEF